MSGAWTLEGLRASTAAWAERQAGLRAVLLIGSYARGAARPDSDVDLVLVVDDPEIWLGELGWLAHFGAVLEVSRRDFGPVQSLTVRYGRGPEIEFGITGLSWEEMARTDPKTRAIVEAGAQVWHDPAGGFRALT